MKESVRILRFAIVGSSNALITALVIWILMDILDCNYLWSNMAGYVAALVNNSLINPPKPKSILQFPGKTFFGRVVAEADRRLLFLFEAGYGDKCIVTKET